MQRLFRGPGSAKQLTQAMWPVVNPSLARHCLPKLSGLLAQSPNSEAIVDDSEETLKLLLSTLKGLDMPALKWYIASSFRVSNKP